MSWPQTTILRRHLDFILTATLIFAVLFLRIWDSPREAINADEHFWHERTNRYKNALEGRDWNKTLTAAHPGATVTAFSLISSRTMRLIYRQTDPNFDLQDFPYLRETFARVHFSYQLPIMAISALFIGFSYLCLARLTNRPFAIIASALLLSDPFFLAHSRLVQMDALQASFMLGSILSALMFHKIRQYRWVALTGILLGLATMTRFHSLAILPIILVIISWENLKGLKKGFFPLISLLTLFALSTYLTSALVLPSLLTAPISTISNFLGAIFNEGIKGTLEGDSFFFGKLYPGGEPIFYYPISLFFRQAIIPFLFTPLTLFFLLRQKNTPVNIKRLLLLILTISIYWTTLLSLPLKKEDRYILPTHLLLDIFAAGGLYFLWKSISLRFPRVRYPISLISLLTLISLNLSPLIKLQGEYLAYYNPLLGGRVSAARFIQVGWGEGLRDVATYLNGLDKPEDIHVASWHENSLAPYCDCVVQPSFTFNDDDVDYLVFYSDQLQRNKEEVMIAKYFHPDNVVFESKLNGVTYAFVVKKQ